MEFKIDSDRFALDIEISSKNTVISGDSGTGKTFLFNYLYDIKQSKILRNKIKSTIDFDELILVRTSEEMEQLLKQKDTLNGKIIILDRANMYLTREHVTFINESKNTFIIMTRCSGPAKNIKIRKSSDMELISRKDGDKVIIKAVESILNILQGGL